MKKYINGFILLLLTIMSISTKAKIEATEHIEKFIFGAGCFWGAE